jgi:hypothetical protein
LNRVDEGNSFLIFSLTEKDQTEIEETMQKLELIAGKNQF